MALHDPNVAMLEQALDGFGRLDAADGLPPVLDDDTVPPLRRLVGGLPDGVHDRIAGLAPRRRTGTAGTGSS